MIYKWLATQTTDSHVPPLPPSGLWQLHKCPPVDLLNNLILSCLKTQMKSQEKKERCTTGQGRVISNISGRENSPLNWRFWPKSLNNGASKQWALRVWIQERSVPARTAPCWVKGQPTTDWSYNKQKWQKNHLVPLTLHDTPVWRINVLMVCACKALLQLAGISRRRGVKEEFVLS